MKRQAKPRVPLVILDGCLENVCFWHSTDVQTALMNVRFEGNNGHDADVTRGLLVTQSGHAEIGADLLFG